MPSTASVAMGSATNFKHRLCQFLTLLLLAAWWCTPAAAQTRRQIHLEISAGRLEPVQTQQKWMEILSNAGADRVRSVTSHSTGKVNIEERETGLGVVIKIQGVINGNKLELPGGTFTQRDATAIGNYIEALRLDGVNTALAEKKAFGLTSEQLVELSQSLSKPLQLKTRGVDPAEIVKHIRAEIPYAVDLDSVAGNALSVCAAIQDELQGLSLGTALAATLRPAGLVLEPFRKQGEELRLRIVDSRQAAEYWPVGWPAEGTPKEAAPGLFEKNLLEIRDFPLDQVLAAIAAKAEMPMLFDYNSMARREIDLSKTNVTFVKQNVSYGYSLRKLLSKTKPPMNYEIRADEAGQPFLWISTAAPAR